MKSIILLSMVFVISVRAQSLTVSDYGAVGDAVQFFVNTVSNSAVVTTTNILTTADISKVIEVFRVGTERTGSNENHVVVTDNEDIITTITNVVNSTNIYLNATCLRSWTNTFATYGTDNTPAFSNAVRVANGHTNFTINIPAGKFLMIPVLSRKLIDPSETDVTYSCIKLTGGGIHFKGAGPASTTLLDKGSWQLLYDARDGYDFVGRGVLVEVASIYKNDWTNDYPISFSDMTMDGGILQGQTTNTGYPANPITGEGWGGTHNAYQLVGADVPTGRVSDQTLSNVWFCHWRAEMVISTDQYHNGKMTVTNCTFWDGNATALNIYPTLNISGNTFSNLNQVAELYQFWCSGTTNYFQNNLVTNLSGNGFAWNGGAGPTNSPYIMRNNTIYFNNSGTCLLTTPGDNIFVVSNTVVMQAGNSTFFDVGASGYQGYWCNSNIVVSGNNVTALGPSTTFMKIGGTPTNNTDTITICSNTISGFQFALYAYDFYTNVLFYGNDMGVSGIRTPATVSTFVLIQTNNIWSGIPYYDEVAATNLVSYGYWPKVNLHRVSANHAFQLEDSTASRIPPGAVIEFDNRTNDLAADVRVLTSEASLNYVTVTNGQLVPFYWTGTAWSANASISSPVTFYLPFYK